MILLGSALVLVGLGRRSPRGTVLAITGSVLLSSGLGVTARIRRAIASRTSAGGRQGDRTARTAGTEVTRSITVGEPADDLYERWRDPDHFSRIVGHVADVTSRDSNRLRWTVDGPGGREVSWETRFVEEEPGELLSWETPADATLPNAGSVRFSPAGDDRGTVVTLSVDFDPPGGSLGTAALRRIDVVPETFVGVALDRFKSLVETGEIPTLEKNASARGRGDPL